MTETLEKHITVPQFAVDNHTLQYEHEGHESPFMAKGEDGHLLVKLKVESDATIRREGHDIISKHYVTLSEALLGCEVSVSTVTGGMQRISLKSISRSGYQHVLPG